MTGEEKKERESGYQKQIKRCVIIGGGDSVSEGLNRGLKEEIKNEFVIATNFAYKYFDSDVLMFVDYTFYNREKADVNNFPLVICKEHKRLNVELKNKDNIYCMPFSRIYHGKKSFEKGIYSGKLVGLYALTFAIASGFEEIYLLGMDFGGVNNRTHFYQDEIQHRGVGFRGSGVNRRPATGLYRGTYHSHYAPYEKDKDKVYNVSTISKIDMFEKLTYPKFYEKLKENELVDKDKLKNEIIEKIKKYRVNK